MRVVLVYPIKRETYYVYFDKEKGDRANVFGSLTTLCSFRKDHFKADEFNFLDQVIGGNYKDLFLKLKFLLFRM